MAPTSMNNLIDVVVDHRFEKKRPDNSFPRFILDEDIFAKYYNLPLPKNKVLARYIWIDGSGQSLRCKTRTLNFFPKVPKDKVTIALEKFEKNAFDAAVKEIKYSHNSKYLPPYFCPRNIENIHKTKCRLRTSNNRNYFDENLKDFQVYNKTTRCQPDWENFTVWGSLIHLPVWTYDGYSTEQAADHENCDIYLVPRAIYSDPFRRGNNILVMCDTYDHNLKPTATNHRVSCKDAYSKCEEYEPWFGIEQEYFIMNCSDMWPVGWPKGGFLKSNRNYFCSVGGDKAFARDLIMAHYNSCLYAGIPICGINSEFAPSQWEYQIGPSVGVNVGDDVWVSRFILNILAEEYRVVIDYDPKPIKGWHGSGAHCNFSTKQMREDNGIIDIEKAIAKLSKLHMKHIEVYDPHGGKDNMRRLVGSCDTSNFATFSVGIADRLKTVRIPRKVAENKKGFLEDRRPSSNCDPYVVVDALMRTCILDEY